MKTKLAIALLFVAVLVLGLARWDVAGGGVQKRKIQLDFWNGFTGPDGVVMLGLIRRFNDANPDVQVSMQRIDWTTYYNKILVAAMDGRGPQVFVIQTQWMDRMQRNGFISDVSDLYTGTGAIPEADFLPATFEQIRYGKQLVGVPLDIWPYGLYYNADLLKQAGIAAPPADRVTFGAAIKRAQRKAPDGSVDIWGFALTQWRMNFQTILPQFDGRYFNVSGEPDLANPNNVRALEFLVSLRGEMPPPENMLGWTGFRQQKVAMVIDGIYMSGDLFRLNDFDYEAAPVPVLGDHPGTMANSHVLCIRSGLSPAQREAAERFVKFLSKNSIDWAAAGQVPARNSARSDPKLRQMKLQYAFSKELPYIHYLPRNPIEYQIELELDFAVEKAIRGDATAKAALEQANANVQKDLTEDEALHPGEKVGAQQ